MEVLCLFLMHLGTRLFPVSTELALVLVWSESNVYTVPKATRCWRPLGMQCLSSHWLGRVLVLLRSGSCDPVGRRQETRPAWPFAAPSCGGRLLQAGAPRAGVCFFSASCAWVGLFCCPGDRRVWYAFPPTRNSFLYLVTGVLYSSSGLWPGCVVLEGWSVGWWPLVTSSGVAAAHEH